MSWILFDSGGNNATQLQNLVFLHPVLRYDDIRVNCPHTNGYLFRSYIIYLHFSVLFVKGEQYFCWHSRASFNQRWQWLEKFPADNQIDIDFKLLSNLVTAPSVCFFPHFQSNVFFFHVVSVLIRFHHPILSSYCVLRRHHPILHMLPKIQFLSENSNTKFTNTTLIIMHPMVFLVQSLAGTKSWKKCRQPTIIFKNTSLWSICQITMASTMKDIEFPYHRKGKSSGFCVIQNKSNKKTVFVGLP